MSKLFEKVVIALSILASVSGCATSSPAPVTNSFCQIAEPIRLTEKEWRALSDESARQIERHLAAGETLCGWL